MYISLKISARNTKRTLKITIWNTGAIFVAQRIKINLI